MATAVTFGSIRNMCCVICTVEAKIFRLIDRDGQYFAKHKARNWSFSQVLLVLQC